MNDRRHLAKDMTDAESRLHNLAFMGEIVELDEAKARVKVKTGDITTTWLPFATLRAGEDRSWRPPEPGEQVLVVAPGGDPNLGVVAGSVYCDAHPAPADKVNITRTVWKDDTVLEYDREKHAYTLNVNPEGTIVLCVGASRIELSNDGITIVGPRVDINP